MIETLRNHYPFPDIPDGTVAWDYTLGGGGRELLDHVIREDRPKIMLEIGCFLCASARRWLTLDPNLIVIGIDPWDDSLIEQCRRYVGRPALTRSYPDMEDQKRFAADVERQSPFLTAMANVAEFRDRFFPVRGFSPDKLYELHSLGVTPDLIYIDCNKKPDELEVSHALWPRARLTGDDWHWNRAHGYPMRGVINSFAEKNGFEVEADWATWVLHKRV